MAFKDKVAIVTGGAQGIGKSYCKALLREGMKVCLCDVNQSTAEDSINELPEHQRENIFFQKCDVTSLSDFKDAFDKTTKTYGKIDLVVNNAGIMNEQEWEKIIKVNVNGVIHGIQLALQYMGIDQGGSGGNVINTASCLGFNKSPLTPVYCATKYAVIGLTKSYGAEYHLENTGVKVNAICPGPITTPLLESSIAKSLNSEVWKKALDAQIFIEPEEVGKALIKILKDDRNGSLLIVDDLGLNYA